MLGGIGNKFESEEIKTKALNKGVASNLQNSIEKDLNIAWSKE